MTKYVVVHGGYNPNSDVCKYVSSVGKDGLQYTYDLDDAITFIEREKCVFFARGLLAFQTVDVYSIDERTVRTFGFEW